MSLASKTQSQKLFEKLKSQRANKVRNYAPPPPHHLPRLTPAGLLRLQCSEPLLGLGTLWHLPVPRLQLPPPQPGRAHIVCTLYSARSYGPYLPLDLLALTRAAEWQWDQLRIMKVGGNESATKYFQSHGGSAALASKDPKVKYESNAANKYKDELKRRAADDARA